METGQEEYQSIHLSKAARIPYLIMRLALGGALLEAGMDKLINGSFSAVGYLQNSTGPFASLFSTLAGNAGVLDYLVVWGEILIGIALVSGAFVRFASFWGAILMLLYYLPHLPPPNGWISQQIIYLLVFITLMFNGIGYFWGLDVFAKKLEEESHPLRILFG